MIITLFYWGVVHWSLDPPHSYWRLMKHSAPIVLILIDYSMNSILVEMRHIWWSIFYVASYSSLLITYTKTQNDTIYDVASLDSVASWGFVVVVIFASIFSHVVFSNLSARRFREENAAKLETSD